MGVVGTAHEWFGSYLEGRSQCVDIGGTLSDFMELAILFYKAVPCAPCCSCATSMTFGNVHQCSPPYSPMTQQA